MWKMDQKTLEQRGIRIPDVTRLFFTPTKVNPNMWREYKCGRRWKRVNKLGLIRQD